MESKEDWDAANRRALEAIHWALWGVLVRGTAMENSPPSPYGRTVDAVARRGFYMGRLAEFERIEARLDAFKVRLSAGYPGPPAPSFSAAPSSSGTTASSGRKGESPFGGSFLEDP
jgi:hypothetical protein